MATGGIVRLWRIYYADGSTFDSKGGDWSDAPVGDIQIVLIFEDGGAQLARPHRVLLTGDEFYFSDGSTFDSASGDINKGRGSAKLGSSISDVEYQKILTIAEADFSL